MKKEVIKVALAIALTTTALTTPISNISITQPIKVEASYECIDKDKKPKEPNVSDVYYRHTVDTIDMMSQMNKSYNVEANTEQKGVLKTRDNSDIIEDGDDITDYIISADSPSSYFKRKQFYYKAGYKDTVENARNGKATSYFFKAPYAGQFRIRWVGNEVDTSYTGFGIFENSTNKELDAWKGSGKKMASSVGFGDYYAVDIEKGKTYRLTFASLGGNLTNKLEMFFIKIMNNNDGKKIYNEGSWYTYTFNPKHYELVENDSWSDDRYALREITIRVDIKTKSKVIINLRNLSYAYEGWSNKIEDYGAYKISTLDRSGSKEDLFNELRAKLINFNTGLEASLETANIEIILDKGSYYLPISTNGAGWDFCFRYKVEPLTKYYTPIVKEYKSGTTKIAGDCLPSTRVYVNIDGKAKLYDATTSDGKFAVKVPFKLKKGMKIKVVLKDRKRVFSKTKLVIVK